MTDVDKLKERILQRIPRARIVLMKDTWWRFIPKKLRPAAFTFNSTIYLRSEEETWIGLLANEYRHLMDYKNMGIWGFLSMYLWPQTAASFGLILAFLAFMFGWTIPAIIIAIAGLVCLGPWPAKSRAYLEMRSNIMELYCVHLSGGDLEKHSNLVIDSLRSWRYYKMVWSYGVAHRMTTDALDQIQCPGVADTDRVFKDVHQIFTKQTLVPPSRPSRP